LQAAIELEFSTVPVYLCGMWSIKSRSGPVYGMIREIVIDEMFHMGLACNMLTSIGGSPLLNTREVLPKYPGSLPGGVRPGVRVALTGLTKRVVEKMYMEIEYPEEGPLGLVETYTSIGAFYDALLDAFRGLQPSDFTGQRQIIYEPDLFAINSLTDAERAITKIEREGEGTSQSPFSDDLGQVLAHYYRFGSIFHGKTFSPTASGGWAYAGDDISFPDPGDLYPMAEVPADGYPESREFNLQFTAMLNHLQNAWSAGDSNELDNAIDIMVVSLPGLAGALMATELPGGGGNFGPSFQLAS
jgi:Ferritin-like